MGLQLLEREKAVFQGEKEANPDFSGKEYILERQLKPEARKDIIEKLAKAGIKPTAMMDISDGLSSNCCIYAHKAIPAAAFTRKEFPLITKRL